MPPENQATIELLLEIRQALARLSEWDRKYAESMGQARAETDAAGASAGTFGDKLSVVRGVLVAIAGSVVAIKLKEFFAGAVEQASEAEDSMGEVERLVRTTGGAAKLSAEELAGMAQQLAAISVYDDDEILGQTTASLLRFSTLTGETFRRAQADAINLASTPLFKGDLAAAAEALGKALLSPGEGLRVLKAAGVDFTEAETKALQALVDTGRAAVAQEEILRRLETVTDDAATAMRDRLSGALQVVKRDYGELQQAFGEGFAGGLKQGADEASASLVEMQGDARETGAAVGELVAALRPLIPLLGDVAAFGAAAWGDQARLITQVSDGVGQLNEKLSELVSGLPPIKIPGLDELREELVTIFGAIEEGAAKATAVPIPGLGALQTALGAVGKAAGVVRDTLAESEAPAKAAGAAAQQAGEQAGAAEKPSAAFAAAVARANAEMAKTPAKAKAAGEAIAAEVVKGVVAAETALDRLEKRGGAGLFGAQPAGVESLQQQKAELEREIAGLQGEEATSPEASERLAAAKLELTRVNQTLHNAQLDVNRALEAEAQVLDRVLTPAEKAADIHRRMAEEGLLLAPSLERTGKSLAQVAEETRAARDVSVELAGTMTNLTDQAKLNTNELLRQSETINKLGKEIGAETSDSFKGALAGLAENQDRFNTVALAGATAAEQLAKGVEQSAEASKKLKEADPAEAAERWAAALQKVRDHLAWINGSEGLGRTKVLLAEIVALMDEAEAAA